MNPQFLLPNRPLTVAILGSSGAVGKELLALLEERSFPIEQLILLASHRSAGELQNFCATKLRVQETTKESFENVDLIWLQLVVQYLGSGKMKLKALEL